jgi:hypothetical protein
MPQETTQTLLPGPPPSLPPADITKTVEVPTEPTQPAMDEDIATAAPEITTDITESEADMTPTPQQPPQEPQVQPENLSSTQAHAEVEKEQKEQKEE